MLPRIALALLLFPTCVFAQGRGVDRGPRWLAAVDHYGADGVGDGFDPEATEGVRELQTAGMTGIGLSRSQSGAFGLRAGYLVDPADPHGELTLADPSGFEVGPVLSAVYGPVQKAKLVFQDPANGPGAYRYESTSTHLRLLLHAQGSREFWEDGLSGTLAVGLGVGLATNKGITHSDGSAIVPSVPNQPGNPPRTSGRSTAYGTTWEFSAALAYPVGGTELQIGARYAAFPRIPRKTDDAGSTSVSPVSWTPYGVYLAVLFR